MRRFSANLLLSLFVAWLASSCSPNNLDESIEEIYVAAPDTISVPDSSQYSNIRVRLVSRLGPSAAYRFDHISSSRVDSLLSFAIFGYHKERTGDHYEIKTVILDSTLVIVLNPPRFGKHYFRVYDSQGSYLTDSTFVY